MHLYKDVNNANRIVLADPVLQAIGKQRDLRDPGVQQISPSDTSQIAQES
jgi:hypothetical protein